MALKYLLLLALLGSATAKTIRKRDVRPPLGFQQVFLRPFPTTNVGGMNNEHVSHQQPTAGAYEGQPEDFGLPGQFPAQHHQEVHHHRQEPFVPPATTTTARPVTYPTTTTQKPYSPPYVPQPTAAPGYGHETPVATGQYPQNQGPPIPSYQPAQPTHPSAGYGAPTPAPTHTYQPPSSEYGPPAPVPTSTYHPPSSEYGPPSPTPTHTYQPPSSEYGPPAQVPYQPPSTEYGVPSVPTDTYQAAHTTTTAKPGYGNGHPHPHPEPAQAIALQPVVDSYGNVVGYMIPAAVVRPDGPSVFAIVPSDQKESSASYRPPVPTTTTTTTTTPLPTTTPPHHHHEVQQGYQQHQQFSLVPVYFQPREQPPAYPQPNNAYAAL